ncbi:SDR family oxidoreductase [Sphingobium sp. BYY-5]|uniref:SDR family NAD(P)-dependent oxidoreductase n=1 Tax=Sphingobium sp. BYY-5 TaxID=2926400 RepID=UPI001FA7348F|nr:SDR family oxidoreductase [Sphingobium sp. BYY-5]MCI4592345.1 SDR family oxidoreductase [Sphingobium sp. BYY-5]
MGDRFAGRTVLVTGSAGGLGRAHALAFAREGAHLILADINEAGLAESRSLIEQVGASVEIHRVDMGEEADIQACADAVLAAHDRLDVLINNAGLHAGEIARGFFGLGQAKWQHYFAVNTIGPMLLAEALRPALARAKGVIINKSSMASYNPATAYGITKAALNLFTHAMAQQFGADEIRCVAIAPGLMATEAAQQGVDAANWEKLKAMQSVKRQGTAEDIAQLALFLASDEGSFINNQVILCDGNNQMRGFRF